jgi:hypothetical protein
VLFIDKLYQLKRPKPPITNLRSTGKHGEIHKSSFQFRETPKDFGELTGFCLSQALQIINYPSAASVGTVTFTQVPNGNPHVGDVIFDWLWKIDFTYVPERTSEQLDDLRHCWEDRTLVQWSTVTGRGFEPMGQAGQAFSLGLSCQPAWLAPRPNIV